MPREVRALVADLRKNPHDVELLRAVQRSLDDGEHKQELAHLLEWWAGYAPDDAVASKALLDAARCLENRAGKYAHELSLVMAALVRDPANEQAAFRLRAMLEEADNHKELERLLSEWALAVRREGAPATLCALSSFMLALVRAHQLDDLDGGISALEDALRSFHEHPDAKKALADLYARRARATMRQDERRAREDSHRAAQLYYELGNFEHGEQGVAYLLRALDLVPHHCAAMEALVRRVGTKNLELLRKRLTGYVSLSPDRVRTHRFRFELVRTLFRERRYAEAMPHLRHLASRGYVEARRILERLSPELSEVHRERPGPELPVPPAYHEEHTAVNPLKLSRDDLAHAPRKSHLSGAFDPTMMIRDSHVERPRDLIASPPEEREGTCEVELEDLVTLEESSTHDELATLQYQGMRREEDRPTAVFEEEARAEVLRRAEEDAKRETWAPGPRKARVRRVESALPLAVVALSAASLTSYVLGLLL